ncbi:hypothetical protein QBC43DRAFT_259269 [Cladorrhinum sp. PSN259]|nr:hypothetical protein QBC43DRAFT_259269 [Cladorrhinum sp. PSN259]
MNNEEFRKLLLANAAKSKSDQNGVSLPSARPSSNTPVALGSRMKSSIPMTPRSVAGAGRVDFAKQLAEQRNQVSDKTQKKFRTSAPKGSRFSQGYVDRAKQREQEEADERAERIKALEESLKEEEIDQETFERLRDEIAGGDLSSTHLVKGLDFKLLERVRRGENVFDPNQKASDTNEEDVQENPEKAVEEEDPDAILDQLESAEVKAIEKEKAQKKGQLATVALNPGQKRSRNQILAELKAARATAKAQEESTLGSKFKKIGARKEPGTRIEKDSKGREVMIIVDEDGNERRKVRKVDTKALREEEEREAELLASREVLGMEVPEFYKKQIEAEKAAQAEEDDKEIKIFDDVDSDYDPLAGLEDSDSSSDEEGEAKEEEDKSKQSQKGEEKDSGAMPPPTLPTKPAVPATRNYFKDSSTGLISEETYKMPSLDDPSFLAALKKAKAAGALEKSEEEKLAKEREERLQKKLQESLRDDEDMDMGFGSSRVEDEADFDDRKVKLSAWGEGEDDDDYDESAGGGGSKEKRKRGGKKRKGDKNNFEDVMRDTFAILLAIYHPRIRILGISTVFGNASLDKTTRNALSILTAFSQSDKVKIYPGASHALFRPPLPQPTDIHGESGLDGTSLLPAPLSAADTSIPAIDAAYNALSSTAPGTAYLIATGAFTNAAAILIKYPELASHLRGVSLMGGAVGGGFTNAVLGKVDGLERAGNWTQWAEFNILADPEAAQSIFGNVKLKGKITLIPLDITHLCLTTAEVQKLILYGPEGAAGAASGGASGKAFEGKTKLRQMLFELLMFFAKTYSDVFGITEGPPLHDPLAVAAILSGIGGEDEIQFYDFDPTTTPDVKNPLVRERFEVTAVTEGTYDEAHAGARTGQTIVKLLPPGEEGVRIPRGLDLPKFWKVLEECVSRADEANAAAATAV